MRSRLRSGDAARSFKSFAKIGCRDLWLMASAVGQARSIDYSWRQLSSAVAI